MVSSFSLLLDGDLQFVGGHAESTVEIKYKLFIVVMRIWGLKRLTELSKFVWKEVRILTPILFFF